MSQTWRSYLYTYSRYLCVLALGKQHIFHHLRSIKKISAEARVVEDPRPTVVVDFDSLEQPAVCW